MILQPKVIQQGDFIITKEPCILKVLLGSCVSIVLHEKNTCFTIINHCVLPEKVGASNYPDNYYVDLVFQKILSITKKRPRLSYPFFLFGGAHNFKMKSSIGRQNYTLAKELITSQFIPLNNCIVGGKGGILLLFNTELGNFKVKRLLS